MSYTLSYLDETLYLADRPIDIGYASEPVEVVDAKGEAITIGGMVRDTVQIVIALPNLSTPFAQMAQQIIDQIQAPEGIRVWIVLNRIGSESFAQSEWVKVVADTQGEFGGLYGVSIADGLLEGSLAPALFVISRDGAIFYREVPTQIPCGFNIERFNHEANRARHIYNGQGCHG